MVAVRGEVGCVTNDEPSSLGEVGGMDTGGGGAEESHEVNDKAGNAKYASITDVTKAEGDMNEKTFSTNLT